MHRVTDRLLATVEAAAAGAGRGLRQLPQLQQVKVSMQHKLSLCQYVSHRAAPHLFLDYLSPQLESFQAVPEGNRSCQSLKWDTAHINSVGQQSTWYLVIYVLACHWPQPGCMGIHGRMNDRAFMANQWPSFRATSLTWHSSSSGSRRHP
jgi:hypothetical protein